MFFKLFAILAVASAPVLAQYVHDGVCPSDVEVVQNFDVEKVSSGQDHPIRKCVESSDPPL